MVTPTTLKTHADLVQELDEAIRNESIRVGDIILWGFNKDMLARVLLNKRPDGSQLPTVIGYLTLPANARWVDVVSHASIIAEVDPLKGIESLIVIESGVDSHTGWSGLMKHPFLFYCDRYAARNLRIVRYNDGACEGSRAEYEHVFHQITADIPFLSSTQAYPTPIPQPQGEAIDLTVPPAGISPMPIGQCYNYYQLLQFAAATAAVNLHDAMFEGLVARMLELRKFQSYGLSHPAGAYFCSQAVAEMCHRTANKLNGQRISDSPFHIQYARTFFEGASDALSNAETNLHLALPAHLISNDAIGNDSVQKCCPESPPLVHEAKNCLTDFKWPISLDGDHPEPTGYELVPKTTVNMLAIEPLQSSDQPKPLEGGISHRVVGHVTEAIFDWVSSAAFVQIKTDMLSSLAQQLQIDRDDFKRRIETVSNDQSIDSVDAKLQALGINHAMIHTTLNTHRINQPKVPTAEEMCDYGTLPSGYIAPCDFFPVGLKGGDAESTKAKTVFGFWE